MNVQELRIHALRRLHELAEAKGYERYFSLDEIAAEVGVGDQMKVLGLGQDLEAAGLVTLVAARDGTSAAIKMLGVQAAEEALSNPKSNRATARPAGTHFPEGKNGSMKVFISHSSKDEGVAKCLLTLLRSAAPVLAPGSPSDLLQGPLADLNALSCSKPAQLHQLVRDIGHHLGITPNSPDSYQDQIDAFASIQTQKSENLDRGPESRIRPLFESLVNTLDAIKLPTTILNEAGDDQPRQVSALELLDRFKERLILGVTNGENIKQAEALLYYSLMPKLQMHGLSVNEAIPGVSHRRYGLTPLGVEFVAFLEARNQERRTPD